ncbi:MAG: LamG-like jellyroll fold domain-containing protein [Planctomycetota bacterium]
MISERICRHLAIKRIVVLAAMCIVGQSFAVDPGGVITINTGGKATTVTAAQVNLAADKTGAEVFDSEDLQYLSKSGEPQIPWKVITVLLLPNADLATVSCGIVSAEYETIEGVWDVAPIPPIATRDQDGNQVVIWPEGKTIIDGCDADIYSADALWPPEDVQLTGTGKLRSWRLAEIAVPLVLYNPASGELQRLVQAEISVDYDKQGKGDTNKGRNPGRVKKLAVNFNDAAGLYEAAGDGAESQPQDAPADDDNIIPLSPTGTSGYVIITTNDIRANSTKLNDFVAHKQSMGFTVTVIDEDDMWGVETPVAGDASANKLRQWLQANYAAMDLKYALIVGDPRPTEGYVPMKMCISDHPTDYFYAELTRDWDLNSNGIYGELGDGVEKYFEVYVGRIPYYGVISDTDHILQKTIDYENASDVQWRRHTLLPMVPLDSSTPSYQLGEQIKYNLLEPEAISSDRIYDETYGVIPPPEYLRSEKYPATAWNQGIYGLNVWLTHGSGTSATGVITIDHVPNLNDAYPTAVWQGSCLNGRPERTNNLGYLILKNGGIGTVAASYYGWYSVGQSDFTSSSSVGGLGYQYAKRLVQRKSMGQALWDTKEAMSFWRENYYVYNLYGDPSVVVMPETPPFTVSPTDQFYASRASSRSYTLTNHTDTPLDWTVTKTAAWLNVPAGGTLSAGSSTVVDITINSTADSLPTGNHTDTVLFTDTTHGMVEQRDVVLPLTTVAYWKMDETSGATAADSSGHGHDATLYNNPTWTTDGYYGGGIEFDGTDGYMATESFVRGNIQTVCFWAKPNSTADQQIWSDNKLPQVVVGIDNGKWYGEVYSGISTGHITGSNVNTGAWTHVAYTYDYYANQAELFINGTSAGTATTPKVLAHEGMDRWIGAHPSLMDFYNGTLDELYLFDYILTAAEVIEIKDGAKPVEMPNPPDGYTDFVPEEGTVIWLGSPAAVRYHVYLGTSATAVQNADPNWPEYVGFVATMKANLQLSGLTTYSWRVDTEMADGTIVPGPVWNFTTSEVAPSLPDTQVSYNFNEESGIIADDSSVNDYDATLYNGATWTTDGCEDGGLSFDGIDDYAKTEVFPRGNAQTVAFWAKPLSTADQQIWNDNGIPQMVIAIGSGQWKGRVYKNSNVGVITGPAVSIGQWVHVAYAYDYAANRAELFINGTSAGTNTAPKPLAHAGTARWIGAHPNSSLFFNGTLDELQVYDIALSASQAGALFHRYPLKLNTTPIFTSDLLVKGDVRPSTAYSDSIIDDAADADEGDPLRFSKVSGPGWLHISGDGTLSGSPAVGDAGVNLFTVEVDDNNGGTDQATLQIEVFDAADINIDSSIDIDDLFLLTLRWLDDGCNGTTEWCDWADINRSSAVDLADFARITEKWLE